MKNLLIWLHKFYDFCKLKPSHHYYEAHITIEPVFENKLEIFKNICHDYKFRVANLYMQKRKKDTKIRSKNDAFCTGRSISYKDMEQRMLSLVQELTIKGFQVWRYKIESTLLDSRYDDSKYILNKNYLPEKEKFPKAPADGALIGRKN